jgi:hypothetical protein
VRNECRHAHPNVRSNVKSNVRTWCKRKPTPLRVGLSAPLSRSDLHGSENLGELGLKGYSLFVAVLANGHVSVVIVIVKKSVSVCRELSADFAMTVSWLDIVLLK